MSFQSVVAVLILAFMIDAGQGQTSVPPMIVPPMLTTPVTQLTNCNGSQFDIVFVLDSSGSVGEENFKIVKSFVKSVVGNLNIGQDNTRVGIITFSRYPVIRLHLDDYTDKEALLKAIDVVPYIAGITETHSALYLLKDEGFRGSRPDVPNIAVVVTDGKSFHTNLTTVASEELQAQGVVMFGIGIGGNVNLNELSSIASSPNNQYVYTVTNFASLTNIVNSLSSKTCDVTSVANTTPVPVSTLQPTYINATTNNTFDDCNRTVADIVFILDSSGSLGINNFASVKQFVINMVNYLDIGVNYTKVGVITYSNYPTRRITLDSYYDKLDLINAINLIPYYPGNTETDKALDLLRLEGFEGERTDAPNIAIVVTDGLSTNPDLTRIAASRLKKSGSTVFSVGIGQDVIDRNELNYISSDPDNEYVFFVANFSDLSSIENSVATTTCLVPLMTTTVRTVPTTPVSTDWVTPSTMKPTLTLAPGTIKPEITTPSCIAKVADLVFVVDSSGSVGPENFLKMKEFMKQTIKVFDIGDDFTRVAVITFSSNAKLEFELNTYNSSQDVLKAVDNIAYTQGGTNTGEALELLRLQGFNNERASDPNIAIVITDGYSKDKFATRQQAMLAKRDSNITIIAIGVGNGTDVNELTDIATVDKNSNQSLVYEVGDFEALQTLDNVVATVTCGLVIARRTTEPPVQTTPTTIEPDGNCTDAVENCDEYGDDICYDYKPWAMAHCQRHCGFCAGPATTPAPCENRLNNCPEYGTYICTSVSLVKWTKHNCPKYCGFCGGGPIPTEPTTTVAAMVATGAPKCENTLSNCDEYGGVEMCHKQSYEAWAKAHCAEFCGFCSKYATYKGPTLSNNETCPDWNLPVACKMGPFDGSCCPMPICPDGYKLTAKSPMEF
ncbi:collagen alpha-1(XII) chain-like [Mercenaria mercenaria]|uniref:collagen alpha-1(XII) chain-like n=1 Tax=Mercenaria mercenaria TaxID=6596 RepID=UPI00234F5B20|nr:collagen alpha-1(XII) chain-like [Mercenaria mercenaria]